MTQIITQATSHALDDDDLLTWAQRNHHWYINERDDHGRICASEARHAAERRAQLEQRTFK